MKRLTTLFLAAVMVLTLLSGCGAGSAPQAADFAMKTEEAMEAPAMMNSAPGAMAGGAETGSSALPENRKWVITVRMDAETDDLDAFLPQLDASIRELEGYVENQEIYNGSNYSTHRRRNAHLTIRIPADRVEAFTENVTGIANVVSNNLSREDITLTYVDTESRVNALKTEEGRLLELLAQADNMTDLLEIEARLSDVRYELESYASRLRLYDNQVDYATIYLSVSEVQEYTPVAEKTVWEQIRDGFAKSVKGLWDGIVNTFVWLIVNSPYLLVWGILASAAVILLRKLRKARKVRNAPSQEES